MYKIKIYSDGSCFGNGKKENEGGWGYWLLLLNDEDKIICKTKENKKVKNTTNNKMELTAAITGCKKAELIMKVSKAIESCEIYTDSAYIYNCMKQRWYMGWKNNNWKNSKKQPVKNKELWEQLIPFFLDKRYKFFKVKGHNNVYWNEEADKLARGVLDEDNSY